MSSKLLIALRGILLCLCFFLILKGVNASLVIESPNNITMGPNSTRILTISVLNENGTGKIVNLWVESELSVKPKNLSLFISGWETKSLNFRINSPEKLGYYKLNLHSGTGYNKSMVVRVSQIPKQLKNLILYYESRLSILKAKVKGENRDLQVLVFEAERFLDDAKALYESELYMKAYDKLELVRADLSEIENSFLNSTLSTKKFEERKRKELQRSRKRSAMLNDILKYVSYVVITALILVLLYFVFGRKKFIIKKRKINTENLGKIRDHFKKKTGLEKKSWESLGREISEVEEQLKDVSKKSGLRELEIELKLVKEKYERGMFEMCQEYLDSLKKKLKEKVK